MFDEFVWEVVRNLQEQLQMFVFALTAFENICFKTLVNISAENMILNTFEWQKLDRNCWIERRKTSDTTESIFS